VRHDLARGEPSLCNMNILGISAFYHDSAAAVVRDGEIVAAAQEERFTRIKHDRDFPVHASAFCLESAGLSLDDIDYLVFYEKPLVKFERLLETYLQFVPSGFPSFRQAIPVWASEKLFQRKGIATALKNLPGKFQGQPFVFVKHHESHAASAYFPSPFEEAAILTVDGVGEWATTSIGKGEGNRLKLIQEQRFPHSLGLLYSAFTYYTGFRVNSGEYKLMGLAPYGEPKYCDLIEKHLIDIKEDGSFHMDMNYFNYCQGLTMTNRKFEKLFGKKVRQPEAPLEEFHMDIAASIQKTTEKVMIRIARHAAQVTKSRNLCLAGGVALNCVVNGKILGEGIFDRIWIQPAAGDAGGALGAALFVWHQLLQGTRRTKMPDHQKGSLLGPEFSPQQIETALKTNGAIYQRCASDNELCDQTAQAIAHGKVVGWFQGRMEFGPRALGGRSILGDARSVEMQKVMNLKIKFRESFRPFAPSVLKERVADYFTMMPEDDSAYMLMVTGVQESRKRGSMDALNAARGTEKLPILRSDIQAVTHVDHSARVQTVDQDRNPLYYKLIKAFESITGASVIINTSFNVRGEPIVCTPENAFFCFMATEMDVLAIGPFLLYKTEQVGVAGVDVKKHLAQFALD
jgi:carbamoyltransferase